MDSATQLLPNVVGALVYGRAQGAVNCRCSSAPKRLMRDQMRTEELRLATVAVLTYRNAKAEPPR